jgi:hypothetical protein
MSALLFLFLLLWSPQSGGVAIEGTVREMGNSRPLLNAVVMLQKVTGDKSVVQKTVTDAAGRFRFVRVEPNMYILVTQSDGFLRTESYPPVFVSDSSSHSDISIEMRRAGTVSGRAIDDAGAPVVGARAEVLAFRPDIEGRPILTPISGTITTSRGEFEIRHLEEDQYYVRIVPNDPKRATTYYPNVTDPARAYKLVVLSGTTVEEIGVTVAHGVSLQGILVQASVDSPATEVYAIQRSSVAVVPVVAKIYRTGNRDEFEFHGVASGTYDVYTDTGQHAEVEVGDTDIANIRIETRPRSSLHGRIVVASDSTNRKGLRLSNIRLSVLSSQVTPAALNVAAVHSSANGEFEFQAVPEVNLMLRKPDLPSGWFISAVEFDGRDAAFTGFLIRPGTAHTFEVVISNVGGTLTGTVKDREERTVTGARVVMFRQAISPENRSFTITAVAFENGWFKLDALAPGDYMAIAFPDDDRYSPSVLRDPGIVRQYAVFARAIRIVAGQVTNAILEAVRD